MGKILQLDQHNFDLWLSYSWSNNNHGICGHTFEVIDYYFFLKRFLRVGIFLAEDIDWEILQSAVINKYEVSSDELLEMKNNVVFFKRPTIVRGNNILFTDGGVVSLSQVSLYFKNVFLFACGNKEIKNNSRANWFVLQDERVYEKCFNSTHYIKKILFDKYKALSNHSSDDCLLYVTKNCRNIEMEMYLELLDLYQEKNFVCLTNKENRPAVQLKRMQFLDMPVDNLFNKFGTYIYTPVPRKFDCSPRFLAECKFYKKSVIFHKIDYWEEDLGLYYRNQDIENNFSSLYLREGDDLVSFLREKIELQ